MMGAALVMAFNPLSSQAAGPTAAVSADTCGSLKSMYKQASCSGHPDHPSNLLVVPLPYKELATTNIGAGKKPVDGHAARDEYFKNIDYTLHFVDAIGDANEVAV